MSTVPEPAPDPAEAVTRRQVTLVAAVMILVILTTYHGVIPVFATRISQYFSLSGEQYGTMIGLRNLGEITALLLVGLLIAAFGVRRIVELSFVGIGGCFALIGLGAGLVSLKFSIAVHGLFAGLAKVAIPAFLVALFPALKRRMISVHLVVISAAGIALPLWADELLQWSAAGGDPAFASAFFRPFLIVGCVLVVGGVLLGLSRQPPLQRQTESSRMHQGRELFGLRSQMPVLLKALIANVRELMKYRSLTIVLLLALHASADNTVYTFFQLLIQQHFGDVPRAAALALSGHNLAYLTTRFLLSLLPEGVGQRTILMLAGPIGGCIILVMLWHGNAASIPLLYTLASLFYAAEFPVLLSEISSRSTGKFGTVLAAGFLVSNAWTFAFLKGTGRLGDTTGDYRLALSVAACGFVAFGVIATVSGLGKAPPARNTV